MKVISSEFQQQRKIFPSLSCLVGYCRGIIPIMERVFVNFIAYIVVYFYFCVGLF